MPVINQILTLEQAFSREHPTWDVMIGGFGRGTDTIYPPVFTVPSQKALPSIAAVAIGPRSQLDRCWVLWDPQVVVNPQVDTPQIDYLRRLTREAPLLFPQIGKQNMPPNPATLLGDNTSLRFLADPVQSTGNISQLDDNESLVAPVDFLPATSTVAIPFQIIPGPSLEESEQPYLHLVFYLKPPEHTPPKNRFPYERNSTFPNALTGPSGSPPAGVPVFQGAMPVHGRRQVNLMFTTPTANDTIYDVRIGGIVPGYSLEGGSGLTPKEITLDSTSALAVSAVNPKRVQLDNPGVDWITIWGTRISGASGNARFSAFFLD